MSLVPSRSVLRKTWRVSHELPEEGTTALFDESNSNLLVLNPLGSATWRLLDGKRSVSDITEELLSMSEGAPDREAAQKEVVAFLEDLLTRGAIELVPESDASAG